MFANPSLQASALTPAEFHVRPQYRQPGALDSLLAKVRAGSDEFVTEKYQDQIVAMLRVWSAQLLESPQKTTAIEASMTPDFSASSAEPTELQPLRVEPALRTWRLKFSGETVLGREEFLKQWRAEMSLFSSIITAELQVTSIQANPIISPSSNVPDSLKTRIRYELVGTGQAFYREQRVGTWELAWKADASGQFRLSRWQATTEERSRSAAPLFRDIAAEAFGGCASYKAQLACGTDYWRTVLDGACGIDIYGHNGVSIADIDGDGFDDVYICQPAGLPNLLYRNRGDGTFEDITAKSGLGLLENTACALFADVDNDGRQDLIVVRASGPLLFLNQGNGKFREQKEAFRFANPPQGTFTGAAVADYDSDGWLDVYFCLYSFYQGADQYQYPTPYYDAENGPPNFLMRNQRDATFRDVTKEAGLERDNTRFSFCCGWGDPDGDLWPDLYVVNDFGRKNLYRNNRDGTFTDVAQESGVEDVGAGMSVSWLDYNCDSKQDLYVADMWTAAGTRISEQPIFQRGASDKIRALYQKHAMGNSLFQNRGDTSFADETGRSGTAVGRWAWSSDAWDFDHDGFPDLYVMNGMVSGTSSDDLNSFFWRQVVANSPDNPEPSAKYEQGWNAINELIRSDSSWSGFERNVCYLNNRDGTFSDVSGTVGLDFVEDGRTVAFADFDHDGRVEMLLKNRNSPQLRLVKSVSPSLPSVIAFRLSGTKSNRDAVGAEVTVFIGSSRQTKIVQAGSGFLAQHSKELFFGLGDAGGTVTASIRWPSGFVQEIKELPLNHRVWIQEGSHPSRVEPFRSVPQPLPVPRGSSAASVSRLESLPGVIETWLLEPVAAPDFSLPDLNGENRKLSALRGGPCLICFWTAESPDSLRYLVDLSELPNRSTSAGLQCLLINADAEPSDTRRKTLFRYARLSGPVLLGSDDVIAVYNILYRNIFDRHRDLSLPTSFLIDEAGSIVKIYQGAVPKERYVRDAAEIPQTKEQRVAKGLPFPGVTEAFDFGRNNLSFGSIFFERGYMQEAEAFFQLAYRDDPTSAEALYGLGSVYLNEERDAEAQDCFERAVRLHADYPGTLPKAWNNLGILAARKGNTSEAIQDFQKALTIDPNNIIALGNLGSVYRQEKRWDDARSALERALQLNPDNPEANYSLGMVYAQLNDTGRAYDYLQRALAARPAYPEALNNLGILYVRTQRPADAEKSFQGAIRIAPSFDQPYLNLAKLYVLEGDTAKAREVLLELLRQHPGHPQAEKELQQLPQ
ncbi:MAG TPA: tetratricopeptide repeat protein [Candidatus Acidoferrum sp.]|nr:tetratricopeptide repeat protein [Candidatus Acidoferrum sp.]